MNLEIALVGRDQEVRPSYFHLFPYRSKSEFTIVGPVHVGQTQGT